jgi:hypothetical protein
VSARKNGGIVASPRPVATHRFRHSGPSVYAPHPIWLGVCRAVRPKLRADFILTNIKTGETLYAHVKGWDASRWHLISFQGRPLSRRVMTRLRRLWRLTWHVRSVSMSEAHTALCDAKAIGDASRYAAIMQALDKRRPLPRALPSGAAIPHVVELAPGEVG